MGIHVRWPILNRVFSTGVFYGGWILCLHEASSGHTCYGLFLVLGFIGYYLYCSSCRKADYLLLGLVLCLGPLSDIFYAQIGLLYYHSHFNLPSWIPPLWVFLLWGLFGVNIHLFSWLNQRWLLMIVLGAIGGPLSYLSVIKLGSATLLKPLPFTLFIIGGVWAIFFPTFIWLNDYLKKRV